MARERAYFQLFMDFFFNFNLFIFFTTNNHSVASLRKSLSDNWIMNIIHRCRNSGDDADNGNNNNNDDD